MTRSTSSPAAEIMDIAAQMAAMLVGRPAPFQGAVLADLLAIWLAGHIAPDNPAETIAMRDALLKMHIATVRRLLPLAAAKIHGESGQTN